MVMISQNYHTVNSVLCMNYSEINKRHGTHKMHNQGLAINYNLVSNLEVGVCRPLNLFTLQTQQNKKENVCSSGAVCNRRNLQSGNKISSFNALPTHLAFVLNSF